MKTKIEVKTDCCDIECDWIPQVGDYFSISNGGEVFVRFYSEDKYVRYMKANNPGSTFSRLPEHFETNDMKQFRTVCISVKR